MKTRKLNRSGIYRVDAISSRESFIIKVTGIDPFFTVVSAFNLTQFEETGEVKAYPNIAKEIEENPKNYVYIPMGDYSKNSAKIDNQPESIEVDDDILEHWTNLTRNHSEGELIQIITEKGYTYAQAEIICNTIRGRTGNAW